MKYRHSISLSLPLSISEVHPMIYKDKILQQLESKREKFIAYEDSYRDEAGKFLDAIDRLSMLPGGEARRRLEMIETPGALPTAEFDASPDLRVEFPHKWGNHQEAREWAFDTLLDHPTFAVDGSQIKPDGDLGVPVAAVQVGWFENRHTQDGRYTKDARFEVLTPEELIVEFNGDRVVSEQQINLRRFEMEIETLCESIERLKAAESLAAVEGPQKNLPVALFDSSLVISFADRLQEE